MSTQIYEILRDVKQGKISIDDAVLMLKKQPFEDLGYANVDYHRAIRQGANEVIFGQGKSGDQIFGIAENMKERGLKNIIITRLSQSAKEELQNRINVEYFENAKIGVVEYEPTNKKVGNILVVTAGTSDINVAEEAVVTAELLGNNVQRLYDVGVAGLHRLLNRLDEIMKAKVIVVIAGMEGALASVVGGLVDCPVIAVPTSIGYGASFEGITALLAMLNSCASGVGVVNIDNGFGAGYLASMINKIGE